jgi:hypothetical protein
VSRVEPFFQTTGIKQQLPIGSDCFFGVERRSYRPGCNSGTREEERAEAAKEERLRRIKQQRREGMEYVLV